MASKLVHTLELLGKLPKNPHKPGSLHNPREWDFIGPARGWDLGVFERCQVILTCREEKAGSESQSRPGPWALAPGFPIGRIRERGRGASADSASGGAQSGDRHVVLMEERWAGLLQGESWGQRVDIPGDSELPPITTLSLDEP